MATLEENVLRIQTAKANIKTAIESKGVVVDDDAKLDEYSNYVNSIQHGGDTSDATVTDSDIVMGKLGYGKDGKVYGARKYVEDGTVYFNQGNLCTTEPVYLDPNNPVEIYSFDAFTDPTYIAEGYQAYVGGGLVTGTMVRLGAGHMIINAGGTLDIPFIGYFEYASINMKTIPGIGDLAAENIAYGKTICGITGTFGGSIPGTTGDYVLPDDFTLDLKVTFWLQYEPVQMVSFEYMEGSGDTPSNRSWRNGLWSLSFSNNKWSISYWNDDVGNYSPVATNEQLRKHGWTAVEPPVTPDLNIQFEFVSLEDKNWYFTVI